MEIFSLVFLSIVLFGIFELMRNGFKKLRFIYHPYSEHINEAGVSSQLIPRFDPHVKAGNRLMIFGSDGYFKSHKKGDKWIKKLCEWADRGCSIDYILTAPSISTLDGFNEVAACRKNFRIYDGSAVIDGSEIEKLLNKYVTYHPTLLETNDGIFLWVEANHPVGDKYAYGIDFFIPKDSVNYPKLDEILRDAKLIVGTATLCCQAGEYLPHKIAA